MDVVLSFFIENYPWIAVIIVAVIITWMIAKYYHKVEDTRKKVAELPCEKHHEGIVEASARFKEINKTVNSTNDMVTEISKWIMK